MQTQQNLAFRPDIEGLRALAILLVVACHCGFPGLTGGYVGVDVFFVISGFLITRLLLSEQAQTGRIDLVNFYARRIRRLAPALFVVLPVTVAAGWLILSPLDHANLSRSAAATAGFFSNIYFFRTQSYFSASDNPLIHTWSLSLEEQFYLIWPFIMAAHGKLPTKYRINIGIICLTITAISLYYCINMTPEFKRLAFYGLPYRAWELGFGAILAAFFSRPAHNRYYGYLTSSLGLLLIISSSLVFTPSTLFPGHFAIAPALGAALLILGGGLAPGSIISRGLGVAPLRLIGRLSYSWYLWHWPLLVLGRSLAIGEGSVARNILLSALALGLAAVTYVLIEQPVRQRRLWPRVRAPQVVAAGLALMIAGVGAGLAGSVIAASRVRADPQLTSLEAATQRGKYDSFSCEPRENVLRQAEGKPSSCTFGAQAGRQVVVWGDSHALHLLPALDEIGRKSGLRIIRRTSPSCRPYLLAPAPWWDPRVAATCRTFNRDVLASLLDGSSSDPIAALVVSAHWVSFERPDDWPSELQQLINRIRSADIPVLLLADTIAYPFDPPDCARRRAASACSLTRRQVETARENVNRALQAIADRTSGVTYWDPANALCDRSECPAVRDGLPLYRDQTHLSTFGALSLVEPLQQALDETLKSRPPTRDGL